MVGRRRRSAVEELVCLGELMDRQADGAIWAAERLLRVRDRSGRTRVLRANAAQRAFEARRGRENVVLKARQMGMTTWVAGRFFLRTITRPGTTTLLVAHTREASEGIFTIVRRFWECLPAEMREGPLRLRQRNAGGMVFEETGSEFRVSSACDANAGRGLSVQNLHCSEVSRWPGDAGAILAGLRAALAPGGELVMESTPRGAYGAFYEEWRRGVDFVEGAATALAEEPHPFSVRLRRNGAPGVGGGGGRFFGGPLAAAAGQPHPFAVELRKNGAPGVGAPGDGVPGDGVPGDGVVRHFFPWWMEAAYVGPAVAVAAMSAEERGLVGAWGLTGAQIGFRRGLERRYGALRGQEFAEDAETCFRATGSCCFEVSALEERLAGVPEPIERRRNGALLVWLPPVAGKRYVVAVDTAGGGEDGDFAAAQVVEVATGLQCAELQERLRPAELARVVAALGREYGGGWPGDRTGDGAGDAAGEALVAVERNNHGSAALAFLGTEQRYGRLYRSRGGEEGWLTSAASKPEAVARLGVLLRESPERFMSRRLLGECRTFAADERGRTAGAAGAHDDLVMAMAVAQAVRAEVLGG